MFEKPENARMTKVEAERYGQKINARSAQYENVEFATDEPEDLGSQPSPPLTEKEIRKRVGEQNYKNMKDGDTMNSINS